MLATFPTKFRTLTALMSIGFAIVWLEEYSVALLWFLESLEFNTSYTVMISPGAMSATGVPLAEGYSFSFFTGR